MEQSVELIRLHNAGLAERNKTPLQNINLVIYERELVGMVVAEDGAKQNFMDLLLGKKRATTGSILTRKGGENPYRGFQVNNSSLFFDKSITENLFYLCDTPKMFIKSWSKAHEKAQIILGRYGLSVSAKTLVGQLSRVQRYFIETIKAIEIYRVDLLVLDEFEMIDQVTEQHRLLDATENFRKAGGSVVVSSNMRMPIFQEVSRVYLFQDGAPVRTVVDPTIPWVQEPGRTAYRPKRAATVSTYEGETTTFTLRWKPKDSQIKREFCVESGQILGIHLRSAEKDREFQRKFSSGIINLERNGITLNLNQVEQWMEEKIAYFPRDLEGIIFQNRTYLENIQLFAYDKICRIPGVINGKLERYFYENCLLQSGGVNVHGNLRMAQHAQLMQTAAERFSQGHWELLIANIPTLVSGTIEFQIMDQFVKTMAKKGVALILICGDIHCLDQLCSSVE